MSTRDDRTPIFKHLEVQQLDEKLMGMIDERDKEIVMLKVQVEVLSSMISKTLAMIYEDNPHTPDKLGFSNHELVIFRTLPPSTLKVADLISRGYDNESIALEAGIATGTTRNKTAKFLKQFNCKNRKQLATKFLNITSYMGGDEYKALLNKT